MTWKILKWLVMDHQEDQAMEDHQDHHQEDVTVAATHGNTYFLLLFSGSLVLLHHVSKQDAAQTNLHAAANEHSLVLPTHKLLSLLLLLMLQQVTRVNLLLQNLSRQCQLHLSASKITKLEK
jgi:hypothetical protein